MALIKCPECGKEISDTAKNCINCGYVLKEENNTAQPQTVIIAPEKGNSAKKSLNKGVTIILVVMSISLVAYMFFHGIDILMGNKSVPEITDSYSVNAFIGDSLVFVICTIVMSILLFAVPKLRKKWFENLYILVSVVAFPLATSLAVFVIPAFFAYVAGIVFIIKSMFIKD